VSLNRRRRYFGRQVTSPRPAPSNLRQPFPKWLLDPDVEFCKFGARIIFVTMKANKISFLLFMEISWRRYVYNNKFIVEKYVLS